MERLKIPVLSVYFCVRNSQIFGNDFLFQENPGYKGDNVELSSSVSFKGLILNIHEDHK